MEFDDIDREESKLGGPQRITPKGRASKKVPIVLGLKNEYIQNE